MVTKEQVEDVFKTVFDPEFRVDVFNLGLVYDIQILEDQNPKAIITMTMTTPACPAAGAIVSESKYKLQQLFQGEVKIDLTFDPLWKPKMMTKEGVGMLPQALIDFLDFDE